MGPRSGGAVGRLQSGRQAGSDGQLADKTARLWEVASGQMLRALPERRDCQGTRER